MSLLNERNFNGKIVAVIAKQMAIAARTAPKARGIDNLEIYIAEGETIEIIANKMKEIGNDASSEFFIRDAENIMRSHSVLLIGTRISAMGLAKCGMCGYENCEEKNSHPLHPCIFNTNDLGIAIGSAVSVAADNRVDNRVMYSVGQAVLELKLLGEEVTIVFGIPVCADSKSPFFDRVKK